MLLAAQPDLGRSDSILRMKIGTVCHGGFPLTLLTHVAIITNMNSKHRKTLKAIFAEQVNGNMEWREIESLLVAIGCRVLEGNGSTVTFEKDGLRVTFHRPHPDRAALRYRVKDARNFLTELRVKS